MSAAEFEAKHNRLLERNVLREEQLESKAETDAELQRTKDELRGADAFWTAEGLRMGGDRADMLRPAMTSLPRRAGGAGRITAAATDQGYLW